MTQLKGGPDAHRYIAAAEGIPVPRPFHLRWFLPSVCGTSARSWWAVWLASWPVLAAGMVGWRVVAGDDWRVAAAAAVLLLALPGILGPAAVIPVGVDLPATALTVCAAIGFAHGSFAGYTIGFTVLAIAAMIRETSPVWLALWLWSPWPLLALAVPLARHLTAKTGPDPLGAKFDDIAAHPIRASMRHHKGRWRDAWLMAAPWGVCLAGLYRPSVAIVVCVAVAYLQLVVATDTVRLLHHAAGPVLAVAAAHVIPAQWLLLACAVHVVWWRTPERV